MGSVCKVTFAITFDTCAKLLKWNRLITKLGLFTTGSPFTNKTGTYAETTLDTFIEKKLNTNNGKKVCVLMN